MFKEKREPGSLGIVITGGSKGLGYAFAEAFLSAGDRVVLCGRNQERLDRALCSLNKSFPEREVYGFRCDVGDPADVRSFAGFAAGRLGQVDRWINNAGTAGRLKRPLWELELSDILETSATNLSGSLLLCAEAVRLMDRQPPSVEARYHIFNMGFSSPGAAFSRSAVPHKASKRGVAELTRFLVKELKSAGKTGIGVHELSPGPVLTDLLLIDAPASSQRILKLIAEEPERVASVLVPKIRDVRGHDGELRYRPLAFTLLKLMVGMAKSTAR
ncbi:SDR family oxidoreductase [Chlorobium ferrooxidans]|uniref:Short-chain dehydrogenase/reductase SDR n=1 Tax=Chlorobium ferrooxidans DSM 13031 TaxID=377431 RepID=Q0YQX6_9CHLB|nr:SDR family oxidoreductase [Chlorobium ferrooxidans]EAT58696.1 Short-chain dehydrogenase/reductase SDR [Chlorobium ferrooxidans DSM 13031]